MELPYDVLVHILRIAAISSATARKLCLLSSGVDQIVRPLLYRKVVLINDRQVMAFAWTLKNCGHCKHVRIIRVLNLGGKITFYPGMQLIATKCENLEELACPEYWLVRGSYKIRGTIPVSGFSRLRYQCIINARTSRSLTVANPSMTHLHLIEPSTMAIQEMLKERRIPFKNLTHFYLETLGRSSGGTKFVGFSSTDIQGLFDILPSIEAIFVKLDVSHFSEDETQSATYNLRMLETRESRLKLELNTETMEMARNNILGFSCLRIIQAVSEVADMWE